jgi:hypothetical protein
MLIDEQEDGVAVAVDADLTHLLDVARSLALDPVLLATA